LDYDDAAGEKLSSLVLKKKHFTAWLDNGRWMESRASLNDTTYWCMIYERRRTHRPVAARFAKLLDMRLLSTAMQRALKRELELMSLYVEVYSMRHLVIVIHHAPDTAQPPLPPLPPLRLDIYITSNLLTWNGENVLTLAKDLVDVLQTLEARGIAHRGLNPNRTLVTDGRRVCVCDYHGCVPRNRLARGVVGEPPYAAPEIHELRSYDPRCCDAWSIGALLLYAGAFAAHGGPVKDLTWAAAWARCCSRSVCFTSVYGQGVLDFSAGAAETIPLGRIARRCLLERPSSDCMSYWLVPRE
jgi:hypothetical protein